MVRSVKRWTDLWQQFLRERFFQAFCLVCFQFLFFCLKRRMSHRSSISSATLRVGGSITFFLSSVVPCTFAFYAFLFNEEHIMCPSLLSAYSFFFYRGTDLNQICMHGTLGLGILQFWFYLSVSPPRMVTNIIASTAPG